MQLTRLRSKKTGLWNVRVCHSTVAINFSLRPVPLNVWNGQSCWSDFLHWTEVSWPGSFCLERMLFHLISQCWQKSSFNVNTHLWNTLSDVRRVLRCYKVCKNTIHRITAIFLSIFSSVTLSITSRSARFPVGVVDIPLRGPWDGFTFSCLVCVISRYFK